MKPLRVRDQSQLSQNFARLAIEYALAVQKAGTPLLPFQSEDVPHFSKLNPSVQQKIIQDLEFVVEVAREMTKEKQSLRDSPKLLWRSLIHLGFTPSSDIFGKIGDDDIVIVYSPEHKHIFQNLLFFEMVTLTLEELYCTEWFLKTKRSEAVQRALFEAANRGFQGEIKNTFDPQVPEHIAQEVNTDGNIKLWVHVKWMSPVKKDDQIVGLIVVNSCRPAGEDEDIDENSKEKK